MKVVWEVVFTVEKKIKKIQSIFESVFIEVAIFTTFLISHFSILLLNDFIYKGCK
ncbi:hypothetical protein [Metabacillus herbersteinensis]|uniref:hypothetical protein n=1 Tax=Metabacillus herbersteinensis TaxID=283816 RepID=UPI00366AEC80